MGLLESLKKYFKETDEKDNEDFSQHILEVYETVELEASVEEVTMTQPPMAEEPVRVAEEKRTFGLPPDKEAMFQQILKDVQNIKE